MRRIGWEEIFVREVRAWVEREVVLVGTGGGKPVRFKVQTRDVIPEEKDIIASGTWVHGQWVAWHGMGGPSRDGRERWSMFFEDGERRAGQMWLPKQWRGEISTIVSLTHANGVCVVAAGRAGFEHRPERPLWGMVLRSAKMARLPDLEEGSWGQMEGPRRCLGVMVTDGELHYTSRGMWALMQADDGARGWTSVLDLDNARCKAASLEKISLERMPNWKIAETVVRSAIVGRGV